MLNDLSNFELSKSDCNKAIKLLEQFERLSQKKGLKLSADKLERLTELMNSGEITVRDLPATLQREFPGTLTNFSLTIIRFLCGKVNK
jgi:hypothetical protein